MGVIVPRYSHSAVERNLVKRRLRELARTELLPTMATLDVVIRAMPKAYVADYDTLRESLRLALARMTESGTEKHGEARTSTEGHGQARNGTDGHG